MTKDARTPKSQDFFNAVPLTHRLRRLRTSPAMRDLVRETTLHPQSFIYPLFVCSGSGIRKEVPSMPGVFQLSVDEAEREAIAAAEDGIQTIILFGLPDKKDELGSSAWDASAPVQTAIRKIKKSKQVQLSGAERSIMKSDAKFKWYLQRICGTQRRIGARIEECRGGLGDATENPKAGSRDVKNMNRSTPMLPYVHTKGSYL